MLYIRILFENKVGRFSIVFFTQNMEYRSILSLLLTGSGSSVWLGKDFDSEVQSSFKAVEVLSFRFTVCNHFPLLLVISLAFKFRLLSGSLALSPGNGCRRLLLKSL